MKTIQIALLLVMNTQLYSQEICDDLIIYDEWEYVTYGALDWDYGDTLGYFADGSLPITAVMDYSEAPTGTLFMDGSHPGLYGHNMGVQFNFLGNEQTVTMQIYVEPGVTYDQYGVYVNESDSILLDADFPIVVDGITIDMEDLGVMDDAYILLELSFTGFIDSIIYQPSSSGIIEVCSTLPEGSSVTKYPELSNSIIYPNPCQDEFTLNVSSEVRGILIYNSLGQTVTPISFIKSIGSVHINIADQKTGLYLLEITYLNGQLERKKLFKLQE